MATWMYAGTAQRRIRERRLEQRRRRDIITPPAFRLPYRGGAGRSHGDTGAEQTGGDPDIQPADPRPFGLYLARETASGFLDQRPGNRGKAANGRDVPLDYQVSHRLKPKHRGYGYYRRARRLPPISPQRLAVYTVLILLMAGLIVIAGVQLATSGDGAAAADPVGHGMVGE